MEDIGEPRGASAADIGEAARRNAHAHGGREHAGDDVGDPVGAEFGIRVGALEVLMAPAKVFHYARSDQDIDRANECQAESGGKHVKHVGRSPREPREGGNLEGQPPDLLLMDAQCRRRRHRGKHTDQRRRSVRRKMRGRKRRRNYERADGQRAGMRLARMRKDLPALIQQIVRRAIHTRPYRRHRGKLGEHHHRADPA